jgi:hypothetical protein
MTTSQAKAIAQAFRDAQGDVDLATKADLRELEHGLRATLAELKADMIKWVAGLLLAQAALVATSSSSYSLDNCRRDPTRARRRRLSESTALSRPSASHMRCGREASLAPSRSALPGDLDEGAHSAYGNGSMTTLPPSTTCMCRA